MIRRMQSGWCAGNRVRLLENGEEFYPRVFEAIASAERELFVETFIIFEDPIGRQLQAALIDAARRGVRVEFTVDGYGSADLTPGFIAAMTSAGVRFHVFDPRPKILGMRTNLWRRLHRKLVVVDGRIAFVGGINFSFDHVRECGAEAKQDYAVEVTGPVVQDVRNAAEEIVAPGAARRWWQVRPAARRGAAPQAAAVGGASALFVVRDNHRHHDDIERQYREAIRAARSEIVIANAYFFPGYLLLRDLRNAARRGVAVHLILQGNPDKPSVRWASSMLYEYLLEAGARLYEYCERPLHGKVAVIDGEWSTVGSSNLDPLSLFLNLEANLVVRDREFASVLRQRLDRMMHSKCDPIGMEHALRPVLLRRLLTFLAFHIARRFPALAGWQPGHRRPALVSHPPPAACESPQSAPLPVPEPPPVIAEKPEEPVAPAASRPPRVVARRGR